MSGNINGRDFTYLNNLCYAAEQSVSYTYTNFDVFDRCDLNMSSLSSLSSSGLTTVVLPRYIEYITHWITRYKT